MEQPDEQDHAANAQPNKQLRYESIIQKPKTAKEKEEYHRRMQKSPKKTKHDDQRENHYDLYKGDQNKALNFDDHDGVYLDSDEEIPYDPDEEIDIDYEQNDNKIKDLDTQQMQFYDNPQQNRRTDSGHFTEEIEFAVPDVLGHGDLREEDPKEKQVFIEVEKIQGHPSFGSQYDIKPEPVSSTINSTQPNTKGNDGKNVWSQIDNILDNYMTDNIKNLNQIEDSKKQSIEYKEQMLSNFDKIKLMKSLYNDDNNKPEKNMESYVQNNQINTMNEERFRLKDVIDDISNIKNQMDKQNSDEMYEYTNMGYKASSDPKQGPIGGLNELDVKAYFSGTMNKNNQCISSSNFENNSTGSDGIDAYRSLVINKNAFKKVIQRESHNNKNTLAPNKSLQIFNYCTIANSTKQTSNQEYESNNVFKNINDKLLAQRSESPKNKLRNFVQPYNNIRKDSGQSNLRKDSNYSLKRVNSNTFLNEENNVFGLNMLTNQVLASQNQNKSNNSFSTASYSNYNNETSDAGKNSLGKRNDTRRQRRSPFKRNAQKQYKKQATRGKSPNFDDNIKFSVIPRGNMNDFPEGNHSPSRPADLKGQSMRKHFRNWMDNLDDDILHKASMQTSPTRQMNTSPQHSVLSPYKSYNQKGQWKEFNKNLDRNAKSTTTHPLQDNEDSSDDDNSHILLKNIDKNKQLRLDIMEINKRFIDDQGIHGNEKRVTEILGHLDRKERYTKNYRVNKKDQEENAKIRENLVSFTKKGLGIPSMVMKLKRDNYTFFI